MQYVVVLTIDEAELEGDDAIENACRIANEALDRGTRGVVPTQIRPLSEVIAC